MVLARPALLAALLFAALPAFPAPIPQDIVTIASRAAVAGSVVDVPIYIRDVSGTPLGIDQPSGSRIQGLSIKVNYAPTSAVQSISISRAGITAGLTPLAEFTPSSPGTVSLITSFQESTNLIPFVSNAAAPGDQVAHLLVTINPGISPQTITLTLDAALTQLTNQAGTVTESSASGLALVSGAINVVTAVPTMSTIVLLLLAAAVALIGFRRLV